MNTKQSADILGNIHALLQQIAADLKPKSPNYRYPLSNYWTFDWSTLGATPVASDPQGVSAVQWAGYTWTRRSSGGKFGDAIWFSRSDGKDEEGGNKYLRLITFKQLGEAERLDNRVLGSQPTPNTPTPQPRAALENEPPSAPQNEIRLHPYAKSSHGVGTVSSAEMRVRLAADPDEFAHLFVLLNRDWKTAEFVFNVRAEILKESPPVSPDVIYDALIVYQNAFKHQVHIVGLTKGDAHSKAIAAARNKIADLFLENAGRSLPD